ncbi:MAG TPA: MaoC family dehydratase [Rhizobiaceae bacterium]|nr:MaoC family dehydratase [Rhizobiaceae bacterium]
MSGQIPTGRQLSQTGLRYGDIERGDWFDTPSRTITAQDIDRFADLTGDRFEIHMSDAAAQEYGFSARVAHGLLVLGLIDGLKNQAQAQFRAIASLGWEWRFERPVLIGDTIRARIIVQSKRTTRHPGKGILELDFTVLDSHDTAVQRGRNLLMVMRQPD